MCLRSSKPENFGILMLFGKLKNEKIFWKTINLNLGYT
jgi:hypothetical protein